MNSVHGGLIHEDLAGEENEVGDNVIEGMDGVVNNNRELLNSRRI